VSKMLALPDIDRVVHEAASAVYGRGTISRVSSKPIADWTGDDALSVSIVFAKGRSDHIDGEAALNALVNIQQSLQRYGEERFAVVDYATEEELEAGSLEGSGDDEP
jgi:hypothetical protein